MEYCNCSALTENFHLLSTSLLLYLDGLKHCECEALQEECETRTYSTFTAFHSLVYDRVCDPAIFNQTCYNNTVLSTDTARYCDQINDYKRGVNYDEWFIPWSPFCYTYAFGASQDDYDMNPNVAVPYNNMPAECKRASIFSLVLFYMLCFAIIIANVTVLLVVRLDPYFHTPYGYFKASIAFADLLVGLIVVPSIIYLFHEETFSPKLFVIPGQFPDPSKQFLKAFFDVAGFFTILTLSVSVYCLVAASLDRYFSISRPFRYKAKKFFTRRRSLLVIILVWILSAIFGLFPFMSSSTGYFMVSATFILAGQRPSVTTSRQPTFNWTLIFNLTSSSKVIDDHTPDFYGNNNFINRIVEPKAATTVLNITADLSEQDRNGSEGTAFYFTLSMYLLSLIIPLVLVWTVNFCTISAYRKKHKNTDAGQNSSSSSVFNNNVVHSHHPLGRSASTPSAATSLTNISSVVSDDTRPKSLYQEQNQDLVFEDNDATATKTNGNFLTVPSPSSMTRRLSFRPGNIKRSFSNIEMPSRPSLRFKSFNIASLARRYSKDKNSVPRRMQRVLLRMVVAFTICLMPAIVSLVLHIFLAPYTNAYDLERYNIDAKLYKNSFAYISSVFLFGNSFVNCIIYTVLGKRFRAVARGIYATKIISIKNSFRRIPNIINSLKTELKTTKPKIVEEEAV